MLFQKGSTYQIQGQIYLPSERESSMNRRQIKGELNTNRTLLNYDKFVLDSRSIRIRFQFNSSKTFYNAWDENEAVL